MDSSHSRVSDSFPPFLQQPHPDVIISNPDLVKHRLSAFRREAVRVLTDFDYTITAGSHPDDPLLQGITSHTVTEDPRFMHPDYMSQMALFSREYRPIEKSMTLSPQKKNEKMLEWYSESVKLYQKYLTKNLLDTASQSHNMKFRWGCDDFLRLAFQVDIPVVIISAGIFDSINAFLVSENISTDKISIAANHLKFDAHENCEWFINTHILHPANKETWPLLLESVRSKSANCLDITQEITNRTQNIILGDRKHDLGVVSPEEAEKALKIGFLNPDMSGNEKEYAQIYDIVIRDPYHSHDIPSQVLRYIGERGWKTRTL